MTPIKIPDTCKPGLDITLGYSGGMALYVANEESYSYLFMPTNVPLLAYITIQTSKRLN